MRRILNFCKVTFVFCCLSATLLALPTDHKEKVRIFANTSTFNYKTGLNIYEGNVKIDQGSTHLTADRVVTQNNKQHKIQEVTAYGITKLAEYTTIPKPGDDVFFAQAKVIKFNPITSMITLEGDVLVKQGNNSFHGAVMTYNMKDQVVAAPASKTGRATIIIDPNQLKL